MLQIRSRISRLPDAPRLLTRMYRTKAGVYFPNWDHFVDRRNNVIAVLGRPEGQLVIPGHNIITNAGDEHYAEGGAGEVNANAFGVQVLGTGTTAVAKTDDFGAVTEIVASEKAHDSGYPQTDDVDADNGGTTGIDVVTYLTSWTKADFSATGIAEGCITNATPGLSEPLLTHYLFASAFEKTSNDTLKNFINHQMNGV